MYDARLVGLMFTALRNFSHSADDDLVMNSLQSETWVEMYILPS